MSESLPDTRTGRRSRKKWVALFVTPALVFILAAILITGFSGKIVKNRIEKHFGDRFRAEKIEIGWGSIKAHKVRILNRGNTVFTAQAVELEPDWFSLFHKGFWISRLVADGVVLRIELDRAGMLILPVPMGRPPESLASVVADRNKQRRSGGHQGERSLQARHLSGPNELKAEEVRLEVTDLVYPLRNHPVQFTARALLSGPLAPGSVDLNSSINFFQKQFTFNLAGINANLFNEEPHGPLLQTASFRLAGYSEESPAGNGLSPTSR